ncbi:MAG: ComEC/Rec2 family competence protein, partial [bacterium]
PPRVVTSPLREPPEQAQRVEEWLAGVPTTVARAGAAYDIGDDVRATVLWPQRIIRGSGSAPNNASVVLLVDVRGVRILLLGDVEPAAQVALRTSLDPDGIHIVKVAHHGSRFQDPVLPAWTGSRAAIISVGAGNDYGHPAPETVQAWQWAGAVVARTDEHGDVAVVAGPPLALVPRRGSLD